MAVCSRVQFGSVSQMFSHNAYGAAAGAANGASSPVGFAGAGGITR